MHDSILGIVLELVLMFLFFSFSVVIQQLLGGLSASGRCALFASKISNEDNLRAIDLSNLDSFLCSSQSYDSRSSILV